MYCIHVYTCTMDSEHEDMDSDATVAPDAEEPTSDEEKSPSFLNTQVEAFDGCYGERSEEFSQPMSPELPLASGVVLKAAVSEESQCAVNSSSSDSSEQRVDNSEPETAATAELDDVRQQQTALLASLQQAQSISSLELKKLREKATELESTLKSVGVANQTERKRLATTAHSAPSQQSGQSQASTSGSLRHQLLGLAGRQKALLQCFNTQKEVMEKLDKLQVQVKDTHNGVPSSRGSEPERKEEAHTTNHSAPIPNLLQHLKQQVQSQFQRPKSTSQHSHVQQHHLSSTLTPANSQAQRIDMTTTFTQQQCPPAPTTASVSVCTPHSQAVLQMSQLPADAERLPPAALPQQLQSQALCEPVPLKTLIQHNFLQPGEDCMSCVLMGCEFKCSLLEDGSLCTSDGAHYKTPNQWVQYCWSQLGQHKHHIKTKFAFKHVMNRGIPLMSICEQFNRKQVCTYHQMNVQKPGMVGVSAVQLDNDVKSSVPGKMITPSAPSKPSWNVNDLLTVGQVFMLDDGSHVASLQLPAEFWRQTDNVPLTSQLMQQLEKDFKWY